MGKDDAARARTPSTVRNPVHATGRLVLFPLLGRAYPPYLGERKDGRGSKSSLPPPRSRMLHSWLFILI